MNCEGSKCGEDVEYPTCKWYKVYDAWIKQEEAHEYFYCEACVESDREQGLLVR